MRAATFALVLASCVALLHGAPASCDLPGCRIIAGQEVWCQNVNAWHEYYSHPTNKHLYVQCTTAGPQVMSCAPGTAWSQNQQRCVNEDEVPDCTTKDAIEEAIVV